MTGAYVTDNGGESWRMFNLGTDVDAFAFDPSNPDVMYSGNRAPCGRAVTVAKHGGWFFPIPRKIPAS